MSGKPLCFGLFFAHSFNINCLPCVLFFMYDTIKGNESDVWNIDFELLAKRSNKFLCFIGCLGTSQNCSYLCNQISIEMGLGSKCGILNEQVVLI